MSIAQDYLKYPKRSYGMDHDRYEWSALPRRGKVQWPNQARIALWITPALEWFPLDMKAKPFLAPGGITAAYPDLRHYTLRDYGNRVGMFRIFDALDRHGIRASAAVNAAIAKRYPSLIRECVQREWEVIAYGLDMGHLHYEGLDRDEERGLVARTKAILEEAIGQRVRGWLSPAKSESHSTPDLVAAAGFDYLCDWVNDDMPYRLRAGGKTMHSMPHPAGIDDYAILVQNHHREDDYCAQICDQFDVLYGEAERSGGRIMAISLHPWVSGQPYRIGALEEALAHIMGHSGVWPATGAQILDSWISQQPSE